MTDLWDEAAGEFQLINEPAAEIDIGTPEPAADLWSESADDLVAEIKQFQSDVATSRDPTTVGLNPEREARIEQISSTLGIPDRDYIRNNYDLNNTLFERKVARSEISDTPVTLGLYDDPATNGAAADDTQAMSYLERMFIAGPKAGIDKGTAQADFSKLGFQYMMSGMAPDEFLEDVNKYKAEMSQKHDFGLNLITEIPSLLAEQGPIMGPILYESLDEALIGGTIGSQIPYVGTAVGFGVGLKFGMASNTAQFEAGASYADLVTTLDEDGEFIDPAAAAGASILVGIANGGIEMLSFGPLIRAMPGGDRLLSMFTREGAKQIVKDRTARAILARIGKRITGAAAAEGGTEGLQELVSDLGKHLTNLITESDFDTPTLAETVGGMAESAIAGVQVGGGIGAIGATVSGAVETKQARDIRIRQNTFEALAEQANNSKLRARLPQRYKQFVDDVTSRNGTVDTVFMSSDEAVTFFQEMDEGLLKQYMPQTYESLQEAKLGGTDVAIPMGEFVTYVAPHENFQSIVQDIKFSPEEITARQSTEFKGREEEIKARQKELIDSGDLRPVFDDVAQKLIAIGQTKAAAYPQAALFQSTMEALASQVNMSTEDFYKQFELKIQNELLKEEGWSIFEQDIEGTPAYESALAKFGPEGMTTEARLARAKEQGFDVDTPLYHGTDKDFAEFKPSYGTKAWLGEGVYLTGSPATASKYAGLKDGTNVKPIFARLNHPYTFNLDSGVRGPLSMLIDDDAMLRPHVTDKMVRSVTDQLKRDGYDGVKMVSGPKGEERVMELVVFDPANIRSVNAAFDPDYAGSANLLAQSAYHGTPSLFDKFSLQFMGTGEGAQAYGWGLYFAGNRKIAEGYRDALSSKGKPIEIEVDGVPLDYKKDSWRYDVASQYLIWGDDIINTMEELIADDPTNQYADHVEAVKWLRKNKDKIKQANAGSLYQVDIPEDSELLDYDKPLSEQPEGVRAAVIKALREIFPDPDGFIVNMDGSIKQDATGKIIYEAIQEKLESQLDSRRGGIYSLEDADQAASMLLLEKGIPGLRYLDATSRDGEGGTHNYVIWDEDRIHIEGVNDADIKTLFQGESYKENARGYIQFNDLRDKFTITLTGKANMSTFLHESGHAFLEMMTIAANMDAASPQLKMDMAIARDWLGMVPGEKYTTKHHEMWARGFEAYLMEGKAPSSELALAFERFKSWMVQVYTTIQSVLAVEGIQLNDEIRGVFDRLVSVDQGMANAAIAYPPMFKTAAEAGMSQVEFERYLKAHDDAMDEARHLVERDAIMDARKMHRQEYKDRKAAITAEVTAQLEKDPSISVKQFLSLDDTSGYTNVPDYLHGHKMDTELTKQVLGVDILPAKLRPYVSKDTALSPDELAPLFGFESGIDMLQGMQDTGTMKGEVSSQVSARMKEEFPDYHMDGRMEADIIEEVHSNKMGLHILAELKAIGRRVGNKVKTSQIALARLAAREKVRDIPLNRLLPNTYLIAEKKASKAASTATAKGDFYAASQFKLQQLLNFYMYKESIAAKDRAERVRAKLDKREKQITKKNNVIGKAGDVYVNAINAILQGIEFRRVSNKALDQRSRLADYLAKMEANGDEVLIPDSYRDATALTNYREMTLNELEGVFDAVEQIASTARLKNQLVINKERRDLREFVDHVRQSMVDNAKKARSKPDFRENFFDKTYTKWESAIAALTKVEFIAKWIDGETAGLFHKVFFQPFVDAQNSKHDTLKRLNADIKKILKPVKNMNRSVKLFGETITIEQVYAIGLNMGNDGNFNKLVKGYESKGWTREGLISEIQKVLTADDFQRIQEVWDVVNSLWPQMSDVYMRTHGVRPPKVEASALVLDDLGVTLRGGYYPIVYDAKLKQKHKTKAGVEDLFENNLFKPSVSSGFMESRTEFYDPIKLSLSVLGSHLNEVAHFITHYEAVRNANKIITDDAFALAFKEHFGHAHYNGLRPWLKNIANDGRPTEQSPFSWMANHMRIGLSMTSMAFNMGTAVMQGFGMFTTIDEIGMKNTLHGMRVTLLGGPSAWKFAIDKSGELRHILKQADREIADTVDEMFRTSKFGRGWNSMKQFAFWHIAQAQRVVNIATWYGAYDQAIGDGLSDKDATNKADAVVRMTQSGAGLKDLAAVQRGGEGAKLFTAFYTYFSVLFNRERNAVRELRTGKAMQFAWSMMWLVMLPYYFEGLLRGREEDDDESGAASFAKGAAAYAFTSIPVAGAAVSAAVSPYPFRASPAAEGFSKAANTLLNLADKDFEDMTEYQTKSAIEAIGTLFHIPTKPITRFNAMMGEDDPEAIARAFLFGQRSE